jgi:hypothetical protein
MIGLMDQGKRQPGRVVERAMNAFAFKQIAGSLGRIYGLPDTIPYHGNRHVCVGVCFYNGIG